MSESASSLDPIQLEHWEDGLCLASGGYYPERTRLEDFEHQEVPLPASLQGAVEKRLAEYLAGRCCARAAIEAITHTPALPGYGEDRAPIWPLAVCGAITHAQGRAAALVADRRRWRGVGLDAEAWIAPQRALKLREQLLTEAEIEALSDLDQEQQARRVSLTFSVKEALFKALYPLTGQRFYFQDAALLDDHRIVLRSTLSDEWRTGVALDYQWREQNGGVLSWILVARSGGE
ncbi:4'-phosphopantetheinyl transferase family protein [Alloalcanivorax xenomutans]|uniref:4'-phosphopantetheinyl transferase family protein n=1 Tax=Alloalcanivorax xenomutans TaxID=1094342 RepID=UPI00292E069D|nr:4'-phosphopantetheinyl transferase superfamily protein [Alloalcanivorax xenomutans]WOA32369.1 4'-phosphopantetheinyl transferase superfamily protein [Alloalcanivorax xenomutans]